MTEYDFLDMMIDELPSLQELLDTNNTTAEDALTAGRLYRRSYNELLAKLSLDKLPKPQMWVEFIKGCKAEMTEDRRQLLVYLLAGGAFLTEEYDDDEDFISAWLDTAATHRELYEELDIRRRKTAEFTVLAERISATPQPKIFPESDEYPAVFNLLCTEDHAPENADLRILADNLTCIDSMINSVEGLSAAAPLVYFSIYAHNRRKLYEKADYIPTIKNLFNRHDYSISADNGKNFDQYTLYIKLYLELKKCFPDADHDLCDMGFIYCSNLAEWSENNLSTDDDISLTDKGLVELFAPMCMQNGMLDNSFWHNENVDIDTLMTWQERYTVLRGRAEKAASTIEFSELADFYADSELYLNNLFNESGFADKIKPEQFNIARALLMAEIEKKFDNLLTSELAEVTKL